MVKLNAMSEKDHQIALVKWASLNQITLVHNANEGKRSPQGGKILKKMGMSSGFPDLALYEGFGGFYGMFLEMKQNREYRRSEMTTSTWKNQVEWVKRLNDAGYSAKFAFGWEDGMNIIKHYISQPKTRIISV
jgi:hypothetical protein